MHAHTKTCCPKWRRGNVLKLKISDQYPTIVVTYNWYLSSLNRMKHHLFCSVVLQLYTSSNVNTGNEINIFFFHSQKDICIYLLIFEEIPSMIFQYFLNLSKANSDRIWQVFQGYKSNLTVLLQIKHE